MGTVKCQTAGIEEMPAVGRRMERE